MLSLSKSFQTYVNASIVSTELGAHQIEHPSLVRSLAASKLTLAAPNLKDQTHKALTQIEVVVVVVKAF